ncbi:hypothetical protein CW751_03895 [Brumimicrobium salinarum]|uniref:Carboxypeptidase-like regulatory domain-containing protein n=1 Tax=Brumimicrobium salinarum TaxID=2058658 RepID=A0A2I0R524_9FLAO|nr:hypothetical protein [Brumimicrobium salinarum]PKR81678.1 hypothetical protein CW751_03895 [Brumimicrobium salinarum]
MYKYLCVFIFLGLNFLVQSQCEQVYIKGKVIDSLNQPGFYNLMVINLTTQQGVFGQASGGFAVYARPGDRIAFSVKGYRKKYIEVPEQNEKECHFDTLIYITKDVQEFEAVTVYPIKSLEQIKEERESLSMRETRTVTGVNVFDSPITALYERFSKKAQSKRLVAQMEYRDNKNMIVKELLRAYVSYDVVYLEEEQFTAFINFLNIDESFLKTASDYDLIMYIQDKLEHYKSLHPELFNLK